jgi:hypothetical protein
MLNGIAEYPNKGIGGCKRDGEAVDTISRKRAAAEEPENQLSGDPCAH